MYVWIKGSLTQSPSCTNIDWGLPEPFEEQSHQSRRPHQGLLEDRRAWQWYTQPWVSTRNSSGCFSECWSLVQPRIGRWTSWLMEWRALHRRLLRSIRDLRWSLQNPGADDISAIISMLTFSNVRFSQCKIVRDWRKYAWNYAMVEHNELELDSNWP